MSEPHVPSKDLSINGKPDANLRAFGIEDCPCCYSLRLRQVQLNGQPAVACESCEWVATFSYLREQARHD